LSLRDHSLPSLCLINEPTQQFTPSDLSTLAQSVDSLEQDVDQGRVGRASANMDDTGTPVFSYLILKCKPSCAGFFSIQVLENALNVWGQR
jgi:Ataxin-3